MAAIAVVPAVVKLLCYPHNIGADDAYIHLRIATNLAQGLGWGINPHQPVNLSTAPAFTLLLAAAERLSTHAIGLTQTASILGVIAGLVLIFLTVFSETASLNAAFLAEITAAFSVNLWRWNGALMEASYGFTVVALVLWMFRTNAGRTALHFVLAGAVLGVGLLLRPEMGLLAALCFFVVFCRSAGLDLVKRPILLAIGIALPIVPWCLFASRHAGSIIPSTFAAKSTHFHLLNATVFVQWMEVAAESFFFPALLIVAVVLAVRPRFTSGPAALSYSIPAGWVIGLSAFYYLKTAILQSPGRYLLPLLPCEAVLLAFLWAAAEDRLPEWARVATAAALALHVCLALALNYRIVMPSLRQFDSEYAATMRAAADELVLLTSNSANKRVLVNQDIGVLSCEANGRFEIFDGGGLASPSIRNLTTREQTERVKPAFLVQSLAEFPDGRGAFFPDDITQLWQRRFRRHGVAEGTLYYYTTIFRVGDGAKTAAPATVSH
jgi:hypothetical protein